VVIDFLGGKLPAKAKKFLLTINEPIISVVTQIELYSSVNSTTKEINLINDFINEAKVYNTLDEKIVKECIAIRKTHKVKLPDAIIAATALSQDLILLTRNTADFKSIKQLATINLWEL
jgi:predicted nucleic acid-binding protein